MKQVSRVYGLPLDPKREVWQLSVGERQRIEIVRALMQNPKFLILDEPTAVLTPQEADQLFTVLDRLKAEGRAILYISHKLEEVKRLCDTATILRGGKKVSTCNPKAETAASLARMMVGGEIRQVKAAANRQTTVPRLVVNDLSLAPDDPHGVRLRTFPSSSRVAKSWASPVSPATVRTSFLPLCRGSGWRRTPGRSSSTGMPRGTFRSRSGASLARRSFPRKNSATVPHRG